MDSVLFLCRRPKQFLTKQPKMSTTGPRWVKDKAVYWCKNCQTDFSVVVRKHHCRHCGQVFCGECTKNKRTLIKFGYVKAVRLCSKCNAMCFKSDLLLNAVGLNDLNTVRKICEEGCDVNFTTTVFPPLTIAANRGFSDMVRLLIKFGSEPKHSVPKTEQGLVVQCSRCGKTAAFDSSNKDNKYECPFCTNITRHEEASETDHTGITALHAAVQKEGHLDCVVALLEADADVDATTQKGNTPLMYACAGGHVECARVLIAHGASCLVQSEADGDSALHKAVRDGHAEIAQLLMEGGAEADTRNHSGVTANDIADRMRRPDISTILATVKAATAAGVAAGAGADAPAHALSTVTNASSSAVAETTDDADATNLRSDTLVNRRAGLESLDSAVDGADKEAVHARVLKWVAEAEDDREEPIDIAAATAEAQAHADMEVPRARSRHESDSSQDTPMDAAAEEDDGEAGAAAGNDEEGNQDEDAVDVGKEDEA